MKILMANWAWYAAGGDWTYIENVQKLYEKNGYEIIPFSTKNEKNVETTYEEYFITGYDYKELNKNKTPRNSIKALKNAIISYEAIKNIKKILAEHKIAFAHLHNIHHWLTPAIVDVLKKNKTPIIWTLHDFKLICPQGSFFSNGKVCEKCFTTKYYNCTINKCKKQSYLASFLASTEAYFYRIKGTLKKADYYLCPTQFLLDKYAQFGFDKEKLVLSNSCYNIEVLDEQINKMALYNKMEDKRRYIFYVGRIEAPKGIFTLINAVSGTDIFLKIAGTGSDFEEMQKHIAENKITNVEILGYQEKQFVYEYTNNAVAVVCPSEWYENYPFSVIESMLLSKPVIGSNIAGIPELIINDKTGYLFEPGNTNDLKEKLLRIWNNPDVAKQLGIQARQYVYEKVNFERHWSILQEVIKKLPIVK